MKLDPDMHIGLHLVFSGKTGVIPSTTRRAHPRKSHQTRPTTRRRVNFVLYWSMNGLPVVKLQVNRVRVKNKNKKIAGIAIMDDEEPPLPPPPMCFMEKHSKVSDSDSSGSSSSDDELSPLALKGLLYEYTSMIKKQKSKCRCGIWSRH
jgi:hypothetical protein